MKRFIVLMLSFLLFIPLFAVDYSEMSTQELIAIIGYVKPNHQKQFNLELKNREKSMTKKEKMLYEKTIQNQKKKKLNE